MVKGTRKEICMLEQEQSVTPVDEEQIQQVEDTETETETSQEEDTEQEDSQDGEESTEVDYRQEYNDLKEKVATLENFIKSKEDDEEQVVDDSPKITKDVKEFLTQFAEDPQGTLDKVISGSTKKYERALQALEQQNAMDFISMQSDFTESLPSDLLMIMRGPDRNTLFNFNNVNTKLKDLPPRQKAEAALQIHRARTQPKTKTKSTKPKPPTVTKSKSTGKSSGKTDSVLTADEFAKKHGIKLGEL